MTGSSEDLIGRMLVTFLGFDKQEPELIKALSDFKGEVKVEAKRLTFTLRGLHELMGLEATLSYPNFRTQVYQSNLNQQLAAHGLSVVVFQSSGKVDGAWYQLAPLKNASEF